MTEKQQPLILALTGRPDVGKDTIGDMLAPAHGFARVAFADALRAEVAHAWRVDVRMLMHRPTKDVPLLAFAAGQCNVTGFLQWCVGGGEGLTEPRSPRWVLQNWATYQRRFKPGYYAQIAARQIARLQGIGWSRVVVTDLREPVELAALPAGITKVVRVHRPDARTLPAETARHSSEGHGVLRADADVVNDGSLVALGEAVLAIVGDLAHSSTLSNPHHAYISSSRLVDGGAN